MAKKFLDFCHFNPRPPRGGRLIYSYLYPNIELFQSTPSAGRATSYFAADSDMIDISIHALRGEGDFYAKI